MASSQRLHHNHHAIQTPPKERLHLALRLPFVVDHFRVSRHICCCELLQFAHSLLRSAFSPLFGQLKRFTQDAKQIGFCGLTRIHHHQAFDGKRLRGEPWQLIFAAADVANAFRDVNGSFQFFNG